MFKYYEPLINNEQLPDTYNYTQLFGLWKGKGSELDLNMMRYIHGLGCKPTCGLSGKKNET